jgi:hypothetical protein
MAKPVAFLGCCILIVACRSHKLEKEFFFNNPPATRVERMKQYSLGDQYRIFRYGSDKFEPPIMGLAKPIAEKGKTVIPFLLEKLRPQPDDITVRDVLTVFETMNTIRSYDVKSDRVVMDALRSSVSAMKDEGWRNVASQKLQRIDSN